MVSIDTNDVVIFCTGDSEKTRSILGRMRLQFASLMQSKGLMKLDPADFKFLWVVDFPLFVQGEKGMI